MAVQSEPGAPTLGGDSSGEPLIAARSPEQGTPKNVPNTPSANVDTNGSLLEQFLHNLRRALHPWPI
jgi:hypothetical protein